MLAEPREPGEVNFIGAEGLTSVKSEFLFQVVCHYGNRVNLKSVGPLLYTHDVYDIL